MQRSVVVLSAAAAAGMVLAMGGQALAGNIYASAHFCCTGNGIKFTMAPQYLNCCWDVSQYVFHYMGMFTSGNYRVEVGRVMGTWAGDTNYWTSRYAMRVVDPSGVVYQYENTSYSEVTSRQYYNIKCSYA